MPTKFSKKIKKKLWVRLHHTIEKRTKRWKSDSYNTKTFVSLT